METDSLSGCVCAACDPSTWETCQEDLKLKISLNHTMKLYLKKIKEGGWECNQVKHFAWCQHCEALDLIDKKEKGWERKEREGGEGKR